ncbi:MAG: hypothetical protein ACPL7E_01640, partial [bacterium]
REKELENLLRSEVERLRREIEVVLRLTGEEGDGMEGKVEGRLREILRNHPKGERAREIAREIEKIRQKLRGIERILDTESKR